MRLTTKVTVNYYDEEENTPVDQAGLFLTAIGELACQWPGCLCSPGPGIAALLGGTWAVFNAAALALELPLNNAGLGREVTRAQALLSWGGMSCRRRRAPFCQQPSPASASPS